MNCEQSLISVILPAYKERDNLLVIVPEISKALAAHKIEILVVDDYSGDGTEEALNKLAEENAIPVRVIVRTENRGFAFSIREGLEKANGEYLVIMDSDGNHKPDYLPFMISNLQYYDCVAGTRFQYGGGMEGFHRQILSWLFNIFVRVTTGKYVTDSLYGYLAIQRSVLFKMNFDKIFWGYGDYCIRLMYYLQEMRVSILQFPAQNGRRLHGFANSRFIKTFNQYFMAVLKLVYREKFSGK